MNNKKEKIFYISFIERVSNFYVAEVKAENKKEAIKKLKEEDVEKLDLETKYSSISINDIKEEDNDK